jgi:hypothetical protein
MTLWAQGSRDVGGLGRDVRRNYCTVPGFGSGRLLIATGGLLDSLDYSALYTSKGDIYIKPYEGVRMKDIIYPIYTKEPV